jgi:hypothetical protein
MNAQEVMAARCKTGIQALFPECTRRIDIGSNWRHLKRPETEGVSRSIEPAYQIAPALTEQVRKAHSGHRPSIKEQFRRRALVPHCKPSTNVGSGLLPERQRSLLSPFAHDGDRGPAGQWGIFLVQGAHYRILTYKPLSLETSSRL